MSWGRNCRKLKTGNENQAATQYKSPACPSSGGPQPRRRDWKLTRFGSCLTIPSSKPIFMLVPMMYDVYCSHLAEQAWATAEGWILTGCPDASLHRIGPPRPISWQKNDIVLMFRPTRWMLTVVRHQAERTVLGEVKPLLGIIFMTYHVVNIARPFDWGMAALFRLIGTAAKFHPCRGWMSPCGE